MASICDDNNGRRRILFVAPDQSRKTIRLGKIDRKSAESICRHVEHLLASKINGQPVPRTTADWLNEIGLALKQKIAAVGLIESASAVPTVETWCTDYIAKRTDLAPRSIARLEFAARLLVEHFGTARRLDTVNVGDAEGYSRWLARTRAANTVRRQVGWAKQFFGAAVKHELLNRNPFVGLAANTRPDRTRDHFVTRDEATKIIDACPDAEWRLIVSLCRYAGLRCPTEVLELRWNDVLWDQNRMNVPNVKTSRSTGQSFRTIPLFPEVRECLEDAFELAPEGAAHVVTRYRDANANLRTQLARIARRAGVAMWDKPFVNMRASCATELAQEYPEYVVTAWLGHSRAVAEAHYWQVTEDHFKKAAQKAAQQIAVEARREPQQEEGQFPESEEPQEDAALCEIMQKRSVHPRGVEPLTFGSVVPTRLPDALRMPAKCLFF